MLKIAEYNKITGKKIELSELEKFGFRYTNSNRHGNFWFKKAYCSDENDGRIYYTITQITNEEFTSRAIYIDSRGDSRIDSTLYDMQEAGYVEKVE